MNENAPTNNPEEEVDMSYVDMAEGKPTVMQTVKMAQETGDPVKIAEAEDKADKKYIVEPNTISQEAVGKELSPKETALERLRGLKAKEAVLGEAYRNNPLWKVVGSRSMESLDEKTKAEVRALNAEYKNATDPLNSEILSATEEYDERKIDETEAEVKKLISENPSTKTIDQIKEIASRKRPLGEGVYSSGDEIMKDANVVLSSDLKDEEKLEILKKLGNQIESSVIGTAKSDLLQRYIKGISKQK